MVSTLRIDGNPDEPRAPSPRELIQARLVTFLSRDEARWTAPYGIVPGIEPLPHGGAARSVYFGVKDDLDVRVTIFTPADLHVTGAGELASIVEGRYHDVSLVEMAIDRLRGVLDAAARPLGATGGADQTAFTTPGAISW